MPDRSERIKELFDRVVNAGEVEAADQYFAPDYVDHGPMGDLEGVEAFKEVVNAWRAACPDVNCTVESYFESGDLAGWIVRVTGTFTGEMMGMPPTGGSFDYVTANIGRFDGDMAVEHWSDQGMFQFLSQVGAIPAPGAA